MAEKFLKLILLPLYIRSQHVLLCTSPLYTNACGIISHDVSTRGDGYVEQDNSIERSIGKRIQEKRKLRGYTQQQFAEIVGLSTNYLSDVERGKSAIKVEKLVGIINALDCSADDIFIDVIQQSYQIKSSKLAERIEHLPPVERDRILIMLDTMLSLANK